MTAARVDEILLVGDVAQALRVSRQRVHYLIDSGQLRAVRATNGTRLINSNDLKEYLKKHPRPKS